MSEAALCVYCRKRPQEREWRPFCSQRCRMADLGRWLSGDYKIPGRRDENEASEAARDVSDDLDE